MANASVRTRLRGMALAVWRFIIDAPLTYSWLLVLLITTIVQNQLPGRELHSVLLHRSTNIHELGTNPLGVLFSSLLWIDGKNLEPFLLLFTLFLAPAEHWLGQLRWLTVGLTSHILATYISEGILYYAIEEHEAPERLVHARDIGVSYFLVGVMAVLTYHIARPWRWGYLGVLFVIFGFPLLTMNHHALNFTAIGHFASILIGLCFYPMARERKRPPLNPAKLGTAFRRFRSGET
ncbi:MULTISPECIES: rhomboid-like protein [unclassified Mycobacterium]|uniref:rhomboid-like protein n=1 Tax=Mycobacterium sp. IS-1264 TaxID=1834158 RepID=UPI0011155A56|nr:MULTISPECIES: rhomboid-like protein [unclassified Mycobacterium]